MLNRLVTWMALIGLSIALLHVELTSGRGASGGRGGGGRSSSGRSSGRSSSRSSSRSSWGSSSRSGSSWSSPSSSRSSWSSPSSSRSSWSSPSPSSSSWSSPSSSRSSWSSPSSSIWGSSSRSGSRSSWSSPSSSWSRSPAPVASILGGSSSSKWGISAPSGSRPASTYSVAGRSAYSSASNRPLISPVRSSSIHVVPVVTNPGLTVVNNYRSPGYFISDNNGFFNGYLLGRMMSGSNHYYHDHYYYNSYVPYRYNYRPYGISAPYTTISPPAAVGISTGLSINGVRDWIPTPSTTMRPNNKNIDYCSLARWNMELPFSELPNMALSFLINDTISGSTLADKSRFVYELFNGTVQMYGNLPDSSDVFQLNTSLDVNKCKFKIPNPAARYAQMLSNTSTARNASQEVSSEATGLIIRGLTESFLDGPLCDIYRRNKNLGFMPEMPECDQPKIQSSQPLQTEEPFVTSINNVLAKYSNISTNLDLLTDLVSSAKACYSDLEQTSSASSSRLFPCLDFTVDTTQISSLNNEDSMFGNDDLCSKYLNPSVERCLSATPISGNKALTSRCSMNDLTNLLVFARNFYLCAEPVGDKLLDYAISLQPTTTTTTTTTQAVRIVPQVVDNSGYDRIYAYRSGDSKVAANSMVPVWALSIAILLVSAVF